jgi:ABC-type transporter Mla maintaining outer membrane lipid asymmetry ATPase subunit MlaF
MVTHDLDSLHAVCDRIAAIGKGHIIATGMIGTMLEHDDPWLRAYFKGKRAREVFQSTRQRAARTQASLETCGSSDFSPIADLFN